MPTAAADGCECRSDSYNLEHGAILCFEGSYVTDWIGMSEYAGVAAAKNAKYQLSVRVILAARVQFVLQYHEKR